MNLRDILAQGPSVTFSITPSLVSALRKWAVSDGVCSVCRLDLGNSNQVACTHRSSLMREAHFNNDHNPISFLYGNSGGWTQDPARGRQAHYHWHLLSISCQAFSFSVEYYKVFQVVFYFCTFSYVYRILYLSSSKCLHQQEDRTEFPKAHFLTEIPIWTIYVGKCLKNQGNHTSDHTWVKQEWQVCIHPPSHSKRHPFQ